MAKQWNDDDIMGRLAQAVGDVPADFIAAGKAAYAWRDIDSPLAELVYIGGFTIRPLPAGPFRLNCRTAGGSISTSWLNI